MRPCGQHIETQLRADLNNSWLTFLVRASYWKKYKHFEGVSDLKYVTFLVRASYWKKYKHFEGVSDLKYVTALYSWVRITTLNITILNAVLQITDKL